MQNWNLVIVVSRIVILINHFHFQNFNFHLFQSIDVTSETIVGNSYYIVIPNIHDSLQLSASFVFCKIMLNNPQKIDSGEDLIQP